MVLNLEGSLGQSGSVYMSLAVMRDAVVLRKIWPAVIQAQHSEKPTIQALVDKIIKRIEQSYETLAFDFPVSGNVHQ